VLLVADRLFWLRSLREGERRQARQTGCGGTASDYSSARSNDTVHQLGSPVVQFKKTQGIAGVADSSAVAEADTFYKSVNGAFLSFPVELRVDRELNAIRAREGGFVM
jgi:hypothetical protein